MIGWINLLFLIQNTLYVSKPQPYKADVRYWSISSEIKQDVVNAAASTMALMGYRFVRVWDAQDAHVTIEPFSCADTRNLAHTNSCGQVLICRGHEQISRVFMHEFGHTLGVDHFAKGEGLAIMNPTTTINGWTVNDVKAFARPRNPYLDTFNGYCR